MNFKFKKPPFYFYIILWIISLALGLQLDKKIQNLSDLFGLVVLIMPIAFAYIWVLKNKIKIFNYYKKIRKKFRHVFYTTESIVCVFIISVLISIFSLGGYTNFKEKVQFEYFVFSSNKNDFCSKPEGFFYGYGKFDRYFWKANTQYLNYFKFKPYRFVKDVYNLKDDQMFRFNHCEATRILLKAAHKGNQVAKDMLGVSPIISFYTLDDNSSIFERYRESLDVKRLYNPALITTYADGFTLEGQTLSRADQRKLYRDAAEDGYLLAMDNYLHTFITERKREKKIDISECSFVNKYYKILNDENSLLHRFDIIAASIGKYTYGSQNYSECSKIKIDFNLAISLMENFTKSAKIYQPSGNLLTTYPGLIYYNGWGNVNKNKKLAKELFTKNLEHKSPSSISFAYLLLDHLNKQSSQNVQDAYELFDKMIENVNYFSVKEISCDSKNYKLKEKDQREKIKRCFKKVSYWVKGEITKSFIKKWVESWFKNPELVKTLNLYG